MRSLTHLRAEIHRAYKRQQNWRRAAAEFGINPGTAWDICHGYEPKSPSLRRKLGLPALGFAPVCIKCGGIHVMTRCPNTRQSRDLYAMPPGELRWRLENREEI